MQKSRKIQPTYELPVLDQETFHKLCDLLFEALKENNSACARVLGISRKQWSIWNNKPPTWPYWNLILRHVIKEVLSSMNRKGFEQKYKRRILDALSELPDSHLLEASIATSSYELTGAENHLRRLLLHGGMFRSDIFKTKNLGGYSKSSMLKASKTLGIVTTQSGFGDDKRSFWRLPDADD